MSQHPARFSAAVLPQRVQSRLVESNGCWLWTGPTDRDGYGLWSYRVAPGQQRSVRLHRFTWTIACGPIPSGMQIDHLCNVKNCVYPGHLRCATLVGNLMAEHSMSAPRRLGMRTHCSHGHEFTPENTYARKNGEGRACRTCNREKMRRRRAAGL